MQDVFNIILRTSVYATIVGLVILLAGVILKNKLNAKWQYLIWIVLILKLVVPFGPGSVISLFNVIPEIPERGIAGAQYSVEQSHKIPVGTESPKLDGIPSGQPLNTGGFEAPVESFAPYVWALGAGAIFMWLVFTYFLFSRKIQKGKALAHERLYGILGNCKRKMGIDKDISLILDSNAGTPSLYGIFRPGILLPPAVLQLGDREIEYILLHELAHYKRRDVLINYLLLALQTVHWFNPLIWYYFRCMRQDMELATDECVLSVLEEHERRAYGKALLAVLEGFTAPRFAPKMLCMVDDKKNIIRRVRMIAFFKKPKFIWSTLAAAVFVAIGAVCLTSAADIKGTTPQGPNGYEAEKLYKYKSLYIGDASNAGNLTSALPLGQYKNGISLKTDSKPYGITVSYIVPEGKFIKDGTLMLNDTLQSNAAVIFSLVDNVDNITFIVDARKGSYNYPFERKMIEDTFAGDVRKYSKDINSFKKFLNDFTFKLYVFPERYSPAMSSTPGIRISPGYQGNIEKVRYTAEKGSFLTWDASTGKISYRGKTVELPYGIPAYWSAVSKSEQKPVEEDDMVTVELLDKSGKTIGEKKLTITCEGFLYSVKPSSGIIIGTEIQPGPQGQGPTDIDEAVSLAIKSRSTAYGAGEISTEGHVILDTEEKDGRVKAYIIASYGAFGFENGVFTKVSGSGAIATVITFFKNENGVYSLIQYKEPMDGSYNLKSKKEMFPERLWDKVLSENKYYPELLIQQEEQAKAYLKSIGRNARIGDVGTIIRLVDINTEASNKLFSEFTKWDSELNKFPYWLGTKEYIEDGTRYIYETSQDKTDDGFDRVIFTKKKEDGSVVKITRYKIVGSEPVEDPLK